MSSGSRAPGRDAPGSADREVLVAERDRWLASLDDIDAERAAGELDDETHQVLHRDYTARAAAVLRRLDDLEATGPALADVPDDDPGPDDRPDDGSDDGRDDGRDDAGPRPGRRRATLAAIAAFVVGAVVLVAVTASDRAPGQTITGNTGQDDRITELERGARERPDDYPSRIAYARALLSVDVVAALEQYEAAAAIDPGRPEPHAYTGWLLGRRALLSDDLDRRDELLTLAMERLAHARALDSEYVDARVFTGVLLLDGFGDAEGAIPHLQIAIATAPDAPQVDLTREALARATAAVRALADASCNDAATAPDDVDLQLACARALLPVEPAEALATYDAVAALAPERPEPHAFSGWISALVAQQVTDDVERTVLARRARTRIDAALDRDAAFADAHLFSGLVALDLEGDPAAAVGAFERALELLDDEEAVARVVPALARARAAIDASAASEGE